MSYLRTTYDSFFDFFKKSTKSICEKYGISNYTINNDGTIDVDGDVALNDCGLSKLPLKFENVTGYFRCDSNKLATLEGSPKFVGGSFFCNDNKLNTLRGAPQSVGVSFYCSNNQLDTLEGSPKFVGDSFACNDNNLITLKYAPQSVDGNFYCSNNQLDTLEGSPKFIGGSFFCNNNMIKSLIGSPKSVGRARNFYGNPIFDIIFEWENIKNTDHCIELFNDMDIIRDNELIWSRLNDFFEIILVDIPDIEKIEKKYVII